MDDTRIDVKTVALYKAALHSKLGITFFRHGFMSAAVISQLEPTGIAAHSLLEGEQIVSVQSVLVENPLHAADLLRKAVGYIRVGRLLRRADFDPKEHARLVDAEREAGLDSWRRQEAVELVSRHIAEPERPPAPLVFNRKGHPPAQLPRLALPLSLPGVASSSSDPPGVSTLIDPAMPLSARVSKFGELLSVAASELFDYIQPGAQLRKQQHAAAVSVQAAFQRHAAQRGYLRQLDAALRLQSAARRRAARSALRDLQMEQYLQLQRNWAAMVVQEAFRRHLFHRKLRHLRVIPPPPSQIIVRTPA